MEANALMVMVIVLSLCMTLVTLGALFVLVWYMRQLSYAAELAVRAQAPGAEVETYHDMAIADAVGAGRETSLRPGASGPPGDPGPQPRDPGFDQPASAV